MPEAPILVLGIGNTLLMDDGVGVRLVEEFRRLGTLPADEVEFLDGGTQGLSLLGRLAGRRALVILDAVKLGAAPGTVHCLTLEQALYSGSRPATDDEGNAGELLRMAMMLGDLPDRVAVIGVEAASLETGLGLSEPVRQAMPAAMDAAREAITAARSPREPGRT
ncbi:MAG: hydrogenase maturation protease [Bryobacterales bacterium]|nr:hydrogenase maturation protease [Bryobacterales bacterium]